MNVAILLTIVCVAISCMILKPIFKSLADCEDLDIIAKKMFQGVKKMLAYSLCAGAIVAVIIATNVFKDGVFGAEIPELDKIYIGPTASDDLSCEGTTESDGQTTAPKAETTASAVEIVTTEAPSERMVFAEKTASFEEIKPDTVQVDFRAALTQEIEAEKPADVFTQYTRNGVLEAEEGANIGVYETVKSNYGTLPADVRAAFEDAGWRVVVVGSSLGQRYDSGSVLGMTDVSEKTIYIDNRENAGSTIYHEMGHFVDLNFVYSGTPAFQEIWSREADSMGNSWITNSANIANSTEYFAEAFEAYCLSPAALYLACPDTYMYLDSIIVF